MNDSISLIIAADSYIYFGDLVPLFSSMEKGLITGGFVAFTLENVSQDNEKRSVSWCVQLNAIKSQGFPF